MRLLRILPVLFSAATVFAQAPDLPAVAIGSSQDLTKSLTALADTRREIEAEKLPRVQALNALEQQVLDARSEFQRAERFQENQLVGLNQLKAQVKARSEEVRYLDSLLGEYARAFRTRTHIVESERLSPVLKELDAAAASPDLDPADKISRKAALPRAAIDRLRRVAGGEVFAASVLGPSGVLEKGKTALFGPVAIFVSEQSDAAGLVQQELNKADPSLFLLPDDLRAGARQIVASSQGVLAVDPTLGNAIKIASVKETLVEHFLKGGVVMWPMLTLALAALVVALIKWLQLSRIRLVTHQDLQSVVKQVQAGNNEAALKAARAISGPAGHLLVTAVEHSDEKKEFVEEVLYEQMLNTKPKLESLIPFLALTAAASPLLGLLGTVTGMIATFQMISVFGTGDPRTMSSGISEALITTEYGLYIAIPAVLAHAFLNRKAKGILGSMEQTAVGFINALPEDSVFRP